MPGKTESTTPGPSKPKPSVRERIRRPPSQLLRGVKSLGKKIKIPKSPLPGRGSVKRFIKGVGETKPFRRLGKAVTKVVKGPKGAQVGSPKETIALKAVSPVEPGAQGRLSPGGGTKETSFTATRKPSLRLKSFASKSKDLMADTFGKDWSLQMKSIPPGTTFTPPPMKTFSPAMKARASEVLAVKPNVSMSPQYSTLGSINSGGALRQAYVEANPVGQLQKGIERRCIWRLIPHAGECKTDCFPGWAINQLGATVQKHQRGHPYPQYDEYGDGHCPNERVLERRVWTAHER